MNQRRPILIRPWQEGDDQGIWSVLKEGSYSNVYSTFLLCLHRPEIHLFGIILISGTLVCGSSWATSLLYFIMFIVCVYVLSFLSALVYLYGSTLTDIKNIRKSYFSHSDHHFWVAECNGEIVGTIAVTRKMMDLNRIPNKSMLIPENSIKVAWLRRMAVRKRYRGFGIAKKLVKECLIYCKKQKYDSVFLITTEVHHAARSLYSSLGFKMISCKPYEYFRGWVTVKTYEFQIEL